MIIFKYLVYRLTGNYALIAVLDGFALTHDDTGNIEERVLKKLLIEIASLIDLFFKPTNFINSQFTIT